MLQTLSTIFFLSCLTVLVCSQRNNCDHGWRFYSGSCYFVDHDPTTWFQAKEVCATVGAFLTEIEGPEENAFVLSLLKQNHTDRAWIGLEDFVVEGEFVWVRNQDIPEYSNWMPNEPNDSQLGEDCGSMVVEQGMWNDAQCGISIYQFVCEKEAHGHGEIIG